MPTLSKDPKLLVATSYDKIATRYTQWRSTLHRAQGPEWVAMLREFLPVGSRVLDLGCGGGIPTTVALSEVFDVTGLDCSRRQIELARANVPEARFVQGDMTEVDLPNASFDAAVAFYSIIHVPRQEHLPLLTKIARWLRPQGLLLATLGIGDHEIDYAADWLGAPMFWSSFSADAAREIVRAAGFELLVDRIDTEIEDGNPIRWLVILGRKTGAL